MASHRPATLEEAPLHLTRLSRYIEAALEYADGTHAPEDVDTLVKDGSLQLWPGDRSAVLTYIFVTPRRRFLCIHLAAGDLSELERMHPSIMEWGRSQGCSTATFTGRRGWARTFLRREGWRESKDITLEKEL